MIPFFSIIIPVYNVAPYLRACLDSLFVSIDKLAKEVGTCGVEIICIDDGSSDGSGTILDRYAEGKSFLRVIHQANRGVGPSRNIGIDVATGEWLLCVDSDDEVTPDYLTTIYEIASRYSPDAIRFGHVDVEIQGVDGDSGGGGISCIEADDDPVGFFLEMNSAFVWNTCYKRNLIGNVRYESIPLGEDVLFSCAMIPQLNKIAVITAPIYHYLQRVGSLAHKKEISLQQIESCGISTVRRIEYLRSWPYFRKIRRELFRMVRTTYIGQTGLLLSKCNPKVCSEVWSTYFEYGRRIFADGNDFIPLIRRLIAVLVFSVKSRILWWILLFLPWRMRVLLLKWPMIHRIKNFVRSTCNLSARCIG